MSWGSEGVKVKGSELYLVRDACIIMQSIIFKNVLVFAPSTVHARCRYASCILIPCLIHYFHTAPLVAAVTRVVGSRLVMVTGGLMGSLSMVVASQSSSVIQLAVSIVVAGNDVYCLFVCL